MRIEVEIERLVLEGFRAGDRHAIGAAIERELGRLLAERGLPAALGSGRDLRRVDGGRFSHRPTATPRATGEQIAGSVYGSLER